jgi:hypothetical protein
MCLWFFVHPNDTIAIHVERDRNRVIGSWAVLEKICGYRAMKFIDRIMTKSVVRISLVIFELVPKVKVISWLNVFFSFL